MELVQMVTATEVAENLENASPSRMKNCSKSWAQGWAKNEKLVVELAKGNDFKTTQNQINKGEIMPGFNRKGPEGKGSMTGRRMGMCNPENKDLRNRFNAVVSTEAKPEESTGNENNVAEAAKPFGRGMGFGRMQKHYGRGFGRGRNNR